jgi:hypothetical protein
MSHDDSITLLTAHYALTHSREELLDTIYRLLALDIESAPDGKTARRYEALQAAFEALRER